MGKRGPKAHPIPTERDTAWIAMYRSGKTLQAIGDLYGVTRERVRQRLALNGVGRMENQRHIETAVRVAGIEANRGKKGAAFRERQHQEAYGFSRAEWEAITAEFGPSVFRTFRTLRNNVTRNRGPHFWQLTFLEWLNLWRASGMWSEQGKRTVAVLRRDPFGVYCSSNVYIGVLGDHVHRLHQTPDWRAKWEEGMRAKNF